MTTTAKGLKDKSSLNPRLVPRATAASAARAARNATNRNLMLPATLRHSPPRNYPSSPKLQVKTPQRFQKSDSKTDVKVNNDTFSEKIDHPTPVTEPENKVADKMIKEEIKEEPTTKDDASKGIHMPECEINETNVIDIVHSEGDHQKENELDVKFDHVNEPKSCPQTPTPLSRPQTPRSLRSSRPQTPRVPSRPTTPAHPVMRQGTPTSRPNTPESTCHSLSKTPSINVPPSSRVATPNSPTTRSSKEGEDVKSTFIQKKKQFQCLKRELDLKQQVVLEAFDNLRGLWDQMTIEGTCCGEGQLQELVVFNVADWTADEISQLCHDALAGSVTENALEEISNTLATDECALADMDAEILKVPTHFADLCLQAFTARQEVIDWVKELVEKDENGSGECLERITRYNAHGLELCESLREMKYHADNAMDKISRFSKRALQERSTLVAVGKSLVREIARLRQEVDIYSNTIKELQENHSVIDHNKALEELRQELDEERSMRVAIKEKLTSTESQLRQSRIRITKMDRQLREAEASIASLTGTVKSLEDQSRQKEVQLEARARKLKESLKTGEVTSNQLAQHRDVLQTEIQELKQQIESMTIQHKATVTELNVRLKEAKSMLEEQFKINEREIEQKRAAESELLQAQSDIEVLNSKVTELELSKPNPDLPTEREMDLWAELQSTKDTLRMTEDEVMACKREKVRFLETLTKITDSDNKVGLQQKLAAELLSKEEILGKMQIQIRELTKNIKLNEQKVIQYEQYVRDLQAHNRAVAECQESHNGINYQELQQEIMNLRLNLLEAVHRNEELSEQLMQKEQHIEQQDKTSRAQARVIKVREELINMLKNKETEQSRELSALQQDLEHRMKIVDEVNKQIATKADEIQELFSTLENKQQQIHRLEKIVLALEEQQRRGQAQRTRHEEKIAALEHELAANGNRRERKFLFF